MNKKFIIIALLVVINFIVYVQFYFLYSPWGRSSKIDLLAHHLRIVSIVNGLLSKHAKRVRTCGDVAKLFYNPDLLKVYAIEIKSIKPGSSARCTLIERDGEFRATYEGIAK